MNSVETSTKKSDEIVKNGVDESGRPTSSCAGRPGDLQHIVAFGEGTEKLISLTLVIGCLAFAVAARGEEFFCPTLPDQALV